MPDDRAPYPEVPREILRPKRKALSMSAAKARIAHLERIIAQAADALKRTRKAGPYTVWERAEALEKKLRKAL